MRYGSIEKLLPGEQAFVDDLRELASSKSWDAWNSIRLIYADWLLDQECELHHLVRAQWMYSRTINRKERPFEHWTAFVKDGSLGLPLMHDDESMIPSLLVERLIGFVNAYPILHFVPGTLKLARFNCFYAGVTMSSGDAVLRFTYCPDRDTTKAIYDLGGHRDGFGALFIPPPRLSMSGLPVYPALKG